MPTPYWRSPETVLHLTRLERPGFAAEFLRRNGEYRRDFAETERRIASERADSESVRGSCARKWGLRFRA